MSTDCRNGVPSTRCNRPLGGGFYGRLLHDSLPSTRQIANTIISELANRGVRVCSLLVGRIIIVRGLFTKDQTNLYRGSGGLEVDGHEIVIHGYFHERTRRAKRKFARQIPDTVLHPKRGEFYDLGYDEALRRIVAAEMSCARMAQGREVCCAACCLAKKPRRAARDHRWNTRHAWRTVCDLRSGNVFPARTLVYTVQNSWRRGVTRMERNLFPIPKGHFAVARKHSSV